MHLLETRGLTKRFGGIRAVNNCSLSVEEGTIVGLIGPNGSGKTTLLNLINCIYKPDSGEIFFKNESTKGLSVHEIARRGIGRTFQVVRVFHTMTVLENLLVPISFRREGTEKEKALELLKHFELYDLRNEKSGSLSFGQQRLLEVARMLMPDPELLLLDEPTSGINPAMIEKLINHLRELNDKGKTIIIVGHDIPVIMKICERIAVLNYGIKIAEGKPEEIQRDKCVIEAYLGAE